MNLEKLNLVELNSSELISIDGGRRKFPKVDLKKVGDILEKIGTYIGLIDAWERFSDGWNSVSCDCK